MRAIRAGLFGFLAAAGCAAGERPARFEGTDLLGGDLTVLADDARSDLVVSSLSRRFSLLLPYAEDWEFESTDEVPLSADSRSLGLRALLREGHVGEADYDPQIALLVHLFMFSRALGQPEGGELRQDDGILILEAQFRDTFLVATARQAPWQRLPEYRTLTLTQSSGTLSPAQVRQLAVQDFRRLAGPRAWF